MSAKIIKAKNTPPATAVDDCNAEPGAYPATLTTKNTKAQKNKTAQATWAMGVLKMVLNA